MELPLWDRTNSVNDFIRRYKKKFWPMNEATNISQIGTYENENYSVAEPMAQHGFYSPRGLTLTDEEMEKVADSLSSIIKPQWREND